MSEHQLEEETVSEGKAAHPIELFFDLVYVFAFTRVVSLIVHDQDLKTVLHGALILGLLWWNWGIWTWTMNVVDITNRRRRLMILISMLPVFMMGFAVPTAFSGGAMWLAASYLIARILASAVIWFGTTDDPIEHESLRSFLPTSIVSPIMVVIGAFIAGEAMQWIWLAALIVEIVSAAATRSSEWHIDAGHLAERHGLIVIIALGEAIIAVGAALTPTDEQYSITMALAARLAIGLAGVVAMWWAYFDKLQSIWEMRLEDADAMSTGPFARDVYGIGHYPMITGIVFFAVALEEAFLHPTEVLDSFTRWMLAASLTLYFLSQAVAMYRSYRAIMYERILGVVLMVVFVGTSNARAEMAVLLVTIIMLLTMGAERWRVREHVHIRPSLSS